MLRTATKISNKKSFFLSLLLAGFLMGLMMTSFLTASAVPDATLQETTDTSEDSETSETETETEDTDVTETELEEEPDDDDDGIDDETEMKNEREISIEHDADDVKIESQLKFGEQKDEIHIEIEVHDEPKVKLEYSSEANSAEIELSFKVKFYSIVEYIDQDANGVFNESEDLLVQEYRLDQVAFEPIDYVAQDGPGNSTLHIITINTTDGVFLLRFYAVSEFTMVNEAIVTPTQAKIDIEIHNFPYNDSNSDLALQTKLEATKEYEHDDDTEDEAEGRAEEEKEVEVSMGGFVGFFSWTETVLVDGVNQTVLSSPVEDDDSSTDQKIFLNYPRGTDIIHDPKIGVAGVIQVADNLSPSGSSPSNGYLIPVTLVVLALVGGKTVYQRKRK
ncbi:MAG: hypothetical protein ACFFE8_09720 [Candidatus Heimdallarchaeota archaeon]